MTHLCCDKCGKCYELQPGESPEDFDDTCDCGEKLTVYNNLKDFYKNNPQDTPTKGKRGKKYYSLIIIPVIIVALAFIMMGSNAGGSTTTLLGSNSLGSVTKVVYTHPGDTGSCNCGYNRYASKGNFS